MMGRAILHPELRVGTGWHDDALFAVVPTTAPRIATLRAGAVYHRAYRAPLRRRGDAGGSPRLHATRVHLCCTAVQLRAVCGVEAVSSAHPTNSAAGRWTYASLPPHPTFDVQDEAYPGWAPNPGSPIVKLTADAIGRITGGSCQHAPKGS